MKGDREVNERWNVKGRYKRGHRQLSRQGREEGWRQRKGKQLKKRRGGKYVGGDRKGRREDDEVGMMVLL